MKKYMSIKMVINYLLSVAGDLIQSSHFMTFITSYTAPELMRNAGGNETLSNFIVM